MFGGSYESTNEYKTIAEGRYCCSLENCTLEATKGGTPYMALVFKIIGGEFDGEKLWHKLWLTEKAYNLTAQQLDKCFVFKGIPTVQTMQEFGDHAADKMFRLIDKRFEVEVQGHDEYNGKLYPKTFLLGYMDSLVSGVQIVPESGRAQSPSKQASPVRPNKVADRVRNHAPQAQATDSLGFDDKEPLF
jgi:hypothetical protein